MCLRAQHWQNCSASLLPKSPRQPRCGHADSPSWSSPSIPGDRWTRAQLDLACWRRLLSNFVALEVYPVAQIDESTVRVRMFAPAAGVAEDAATGSAAAALAGWLIQQAPDPSGTRHWTVLQGESVGRPSRIELEADVRDGAVQAVRVGGASVMVSEGTLRL